MTPWNRVRCERRPSREWSPGSRHFLCQENEDTVSRGMSGRIQERWRKRGNGFGSRRHPDTHERGRDWLITPVHTHLSFIVLIDPRQGHFPRPRHHPFVGRGFSKRRFNYGSIKRVGSSWSRDTTRTVRRGRVLDIRTGTRGQVRLVLRTMEDCRKKLWPVDGRTDLEILDVDLRSSDIMKRNFGDCLSCTVLIMDGLGQHDTRRTT